MRQRSLLFSFVLYRILLALSLVAASSACASVESQSLDMAVQEPETAATAMPMASFSPLVGGDWRLASGTSAFHAWQWGPGKHSMRKMTHASEVTANPWAGEVMYWHPGRKQVRTLSVHGDIPGVGRGVGEGTITFDGKTADGLVDLHQPRGLRKLGVRWDFDGPDKYRDALLEDTGEGLEPLAAWDFIRIPTRHEMKTSTPPDQKDLPAGLRVLEPLVGHTWEAKGASSDLGTDFHAQSTFEWVPSVEVVCARTVSLRRQDESKELLDAYFYEPIGSGPVRCLALSSRGGVYEGDLTAIEGDVLQLNLNGYEGTQVVSQVVRFDFEKDGTLRTRVWSLEGADRMLRLDVHHKKVEPKKE